MVYICSTLALLTAALATEGAAGGEAGLWGNRPVWTMTAAWTDKNMEEGFAPDMKDADAVLTWGAGAAGFSKVPATDILAAMYCIAPAEMEADPRHRHSRHDIHYPARPYPETQLVIPRAVPKFRPVIIRIVWRPRPARAGTR